MLRNLCCLLLVFLLTGCVSATRLGISGADWKKMSPAMQQKAVQNYKEIKSTYARSRTESVYNGPILSVYFLRGKAFMPPFTQAYSIETTEFKIAPGVCKFVRLKSIDTNNSTNIRVCYDGARLSLDPSRYQLDKANGSVHFDYNPIWKRGFTYSDVKSGGYVRLEDASISIKAIPAHLASKYAKYTRH